MISPRMRPPHPSPDWKLSGQLNLVTAARVGSLGPIQQGEIAERIQDGEGAREVVVEYLPTGDGRHRDATHALMSFCRSLAKGVHDLDGRADRTWKVTLVESRPVLVQARDL